MKVGDIIKFKDDTGVTRPIKAGIILKIFKKKCWRTDKLGSKINWDLVEPEDHAEVMINENVLSMPTIDLEVLNNDKKDV
jgi:hypothetical protein